MKSFPRFVALTGLFFSIAQLPAQDRPGVSPSQWLEQMDGNRDGKLAKAETGGLMLRFFDRNDGNSDGFLDGEELKDLAERLQKRQSGKARTRGAMSTEKLLASAPGNVTVLPDLAYREGDSDAWKLDLVMPRENGEELRPGIVFVHGGGWRSGDKRSGYFLQGALEYAQKGYVCITVNYRLTGEAPFPACIEDVKCAVRWFRANAERFQLDPNRIGGYGNSAGAHLVSMLGLAKPEVGLEGDGPYQEQSSLLQAVCASATPTDFSLFSSMRNFDAKTIGDRYDPEELARLSSPITHVRADAPPFLLIHGTADSTVHVQHSDTFSTALKEAGADVVEYIRTDAAGHGVFNQNKQTTHPAMAAFFDRHLREKQ